MGMCLTGNINIKYNETKIDDFSTADPKESAIDEINEHSQQITNVLLLEDMSTNHLSSSINNEVVSMKKPILSKLVLKKKRNNNNINIYTGNTYNYVC